MAEAPSVRTSIRSIALKGISDKSANTPPRPPSTGRAPSIKTSVDDGPRPRRLMLDAKVPSVPEPLRVVAPSVVSFGGSEEHTSELQSLMRISYAVFCLKKQKK